MKKLVIIICFSLFVLLIGCQSEESIENKIINSIEFWGDTGIYSIDISNSSTTNHTVIFSGSIQYWDEPYDTVLNNIREISLNLEKNKEIVIPHDNITWEISKANGESVFKLELSNINIENCDCFKINSILFMLPDKEIIKNLSEFYIQSYQDSKNRLSVMESPVASKSDLTVNKENMCTYRILSINSESNDKFDAQFVFPSELDAYITISGININRDTETEDQVKETYKNELSEKDINNLKVYQIDCYYTITKTANIIFQPYISLNINGYYQTISPLAPLMLSCK